MFDSVRGVASTYSVEVECLRWLVSGTGVHLKADALLREKVEPQVQRIEEAVSENVSLKELAYRTACYGATPATFGAVIGVASNLPTLAGAAAGGLPILGAAGIKALLDRRDKLREIKDNQLYFYYWAGERLKTRLGGR